MNKTEIEQAYRNMKPCISKTPLMRSEKLSSLIQGEVYLKLENQQLTGSFKVRGALQVMASLPTDTKYNGVVAPTAGNHGMGLAYAGNKAGVPVHIYLPSTADAAKVSFMEELGAHITYFPNIETARQAALKAAADQGLTFVSAYNNPNMIAGAGTLALEILNELPDLDIAVVCTGGGGLTAGMGLYLKAQQSRSRLVAVQTENSPTFAAWYKHGKVTQIALAPSIAEGLSGYIDPSTISFPIFKEVVDEVVTISETEITTAMRWLLEEHELVIEPSGAAGVAALLAGKVAVAGKKVVVTVTGGNISPERFGYLIKTGLSS
ncbi:threonine ammonia-lyase [Pontibacter sp. MBLB2868]|uniref:threonine ammonia-lyase n=1 Tax=Pontibacter sp. MBLB2868 TaxID=3451555 RepID=UPI003F74AE80